MKNKDLIKVYYTLIDAITTLVNSIEGAELNCSIGRRYPKSETRISNNNSYTEADREYLQGRELSG